MMSARITPSLVKYTQMRYGSYQPHLMQSIATMKLSTISAGREPNRSAVTAVDILPVPRSFNSIIFRPYTSKQPQLPTKSDLEKVFFKLTVIIWDLVSMVSAWAWAFFKNKILFNPTVQTYWKIFNQKLNDARKN